MTPEQFHTAVLAWFDQYGRKDLPWKIDPTPYAVWVSEVMLQQTQVATVIPYFQRFVKKFPDVHRLAAASTDEVLHLWSGLGYYARARNLHKTARLVVEQGGAFPANLDGLCTLSGIGRSTAGAILSMAFEIRAPILDGNVKRVLTRFHGIEGWPGDGRITRELWRLSDRFTPGDRIADYTQAIMDIGASVCKRKAPDCLSCPISLGCAAYKEGLVEKLPTPRPAKQLPEKKIYFLILRNPEGKVLLEKRPPIGIWGGLWSFPEYTIKAELEERSGKYGIATSSLIWMERRRHTFSHFHLDYTPVLAACPASPNLVMEAGQSFWYNRSGKNPCGLPTPVSRLIKQLDDIR